MRTAVVILASRSLVASERVETRNDDVIQLQLSSASKTTKAAADLDGFVQHLSSLKMNPENLVSTEQSVEQIAQAVESGVLNAEKFDKETIKALHQFQKFVDEIKKDIISAHKDDQEDLDGAHTTGFGNCMKQFNTATAENDALEEKWKEKEEKHMKCRESQRKLAEDMQSSCDDVVDFTKSLQRVAAIPATTDWLPDLTSTCASVKDTSKSTFDKYFTDAKAKLEGEFKQWETVSGKCNTYSGLAAKKKDECEDVQECFENDFCSWRNAAYHNCYEQMQCQDGKMDNFAAVRAETLKRAEIRKIHWQSGEHITCFLKVMLHSGAKQSHVEDCKKDLDTSHLDMDVPEKKMEIEKCDLPDLKTHPGASKWASRYSKSKCTAVKSKECEAVPVHVLKRLGLWKIDLPEKNCPTPDGAKVCHYWGDPHFSHLFFSNRQISASQKGGWQGGTILEFKPAGFFELASNEDDSFQAQAFFCNRGGGAPGVGQGVAMRFGHDILQILKGTDNDKDHTEIRLNGVDMTYESIGGKKGSIWGKDVIGTGGVTTGYLFLQAMKTNRHNGNNKFATCAGNGPDGDTILEVNGHSNHASYWSSMTLRTNKPGKKGICNTPNGKMSTAEQENYRVDPKNSLFTTRQTQHLCNTCNFGNFGKFNNKNHACRAPAHDATAEEVCKSTGYDYKKAKASCEKEFKNNKAWLDVCAMETCATGEDAVAISKIEEHIQEKMDKDDQVVVQR